jgi:long-chain acyl-CoA synthetase
LENFLIAVVVLDDDYVKKWAANEGIDVQTLSSKEFNSKLKQTVLEDMIREGKRRGLMPYEQVKTIEFIKESFTIENGLLTPTFKIRRFAVENKYKDFFGKIYQSFKT